MTAATSERHATGLIHILVPWPPSLSSPCYLRSAYRVDGDRISRNVTVPNAVMGMSGPAEDKGFLACQPASVSAAVGISRMWVLPQHRRTGVTYNLVDCARYGGGTFSQHTHLHATKPASTSHSRTHWHPSRSCLLPCWRMPLTPGSPSTVSLPRQCADPT